MSHILDCPIWSALVSRHAHLGEGDALARRYRPDISPFAAARDDSPESLAALARLVGPGDRQVMAQAAPVALPAELTVASSAPGVQMVAVRLAPAMADARIAPLGESDAAEMLALAQLTRPGPFTLRSQELGGFFGIRIDGRIAAMAGERLKQPGWSELSGVATHPDFRRQGLARVLSLHVANLIAARGEVPYLHAWAANTQAIGLYESIGFELRSPMNIAVVQRA